MTGRLEPATAELDWDTINRWLPALAGDIDPGAWAAPQQLADGVVAMGYVALYEHPDLLRDATLDDCRRLLIALVRGDRFDEGVLLEAFDDGTIRQILTRTTELTAA